MYDSTIDTIEHISNLVKVASPIVTDFRERIIHHDASKLKNPEKACYDEMVPKLKETRYGSKEYIAIRKEMQEKGLDHHYAMNRHHPEHFENGIHGMNLVDIIEMLCDWYAASLKSDTEFEKGFKANVERFHISKDMEEILWNTYNVYLRGK